MNASSSQASPRKTYSGLSDAQRAERVADRRERFVVAGSELFGTIGLRHTTVKGLCKAAGLTERYFYESFPAIEDLFCAVYDRQTTKIREHFISQIPLMPRDLPARARMALDSYFTMMRDERLVRILHIEVMGASERITAMHEADVRLAGQVAAFLLRSDNPELQLSEDLAMSVGMTLNGGITALAVQWMMGGYKLPQETVVESCTLVVLGTMHALKHRS